MEEKSVEFIKGFEAAERAFMSNEAEPKFENPFEAGTEAHRGYEEAVYVFTQK